MSVEANTLLLTIKNLQRYEVLENSTFSKLTTGTAHFLYDNLQLLINGLFVLTWLCIRLVYFPYLVLSLYRYLSGGIFGYYQHLVTGLVIGLCILNYYWSKKIAPLGLLFFIAQFVVASLCLL
jgi:hypothetical protein